MSFGFSGLGGGEGGGVGLKGLKGLEGFIGFIGFRVQDCKGLFLLRVLVKDTFEGFAREGSRRGYITRINFAFRGSVGVQGFRAQDLGRGFFFLFSPGCLAGF